MRSPCSTREPAVLSASKSAHGLETRGSRPNFVLVWCHIIPIAPTQGVGLASAAVRRYIVPIGPTQGVVPLAVTWIIPTGGIVPISRRVFPILHFSCCNGRRRLECDCIGQRRRGVVSGPTTPIAIASFEALIVIRLSSYYCLRCSAQPERGAPVWGGAAWFSFIGDIAGP